MKLLVPQVVCPIRLTMKNKVTGDIQTAWFSTIQEANTCINQVDTRMAGLDYWLQNMPKGQEQIIQFDLDQAENGAVYLQDTYHPTIGTSCIRFYIANNSQGYITIQTKLFTIEHIQSTVQNHAKIMIQTIDPMKDMPIYTDLLTYLPGQWFDKEDLLLHFYINSISNLLTGPVLKEEHVHDENCLHDHGSETATNAEEITKQLQQISDEVDKIINKQDPQPANNGFSVTPISQESNEIQKFQTQEQQQTQEETQKEKAQVNNNEPFDYDENAIESDQTVQLMPEGNTY